MDKFWELLKDSVIISGTMALTLTGAATYLWVTGQKVPEELYLLLGAIVGYFFGSGKVQQAVSVLHSR